MSGPCQHPRRRAPLSHRAAAHAPARDARENQERAARGLCGRRDAAELGSP